MIPKRTLRFLYNMPIIHVTGFEPVTLCVINRSSTTELNVKLLTYLEVPLPLLHILLGYRIQHSDCFSPCGILDHTSGLAPLILLCSSFTRMIEHHNYQFTVRISCFGLLWNRTPILLSLTDRLWAYILSDHNSTPCDGCLDRQLYAFGQAESYTTLACIVGLLRAQVCRNSCIGHIAVVILYRALCRS